MFLIIQGKNEDAIVLGELDEGFLAFEQALNAEIKGIPRGWWAEAEAGAIGMRREIWSSRGSNSAIVRSDG